MDIILLEPQTSGNIGAVARVMKNFGFENLILVNPCEIDNEAVARAMHAKNVLENAEVREWDKLDYDFLIGTTAKVGGDYNIKRSPVSPKELAERISQLEGNPKIGLVFGREDKGMYNEEILKCDFIVAIPTKPEYPTLNLSHAVAVLLYELSDGEKIGEGIKPIGRKEKEVLLQLIYGALDRMEFQTDEKREKHKILWKRIIGRAMLTNREAQALMGMFKKN